MKKKVTAGQVLRLAKTHNLAEVGRILGISRERVRQIASKQPNYHKNNFSHESRLKMKAIIDSGLLGEKTDNALAKEFDVQQNFVRLVRKSQNIPKALSFRKKILEQIKNDGVLGKMSDVDVAKKYNYFQQIICALRRSLGIPKYQKPIGCDECVTSNYLGSGLCRHCYRKDYSRRYFQSKKQSKQEKGTL